MKLIKIKYSQTHHKELNQLIQQILIIKLLKARIIHNNMFFLLRKRH